jgi:hypothetical protein
MKEKVRNLGLIFTCLIKVGKARRQLEYRGMYYQGQKSPEDKHEA